MTGEDIAGIVDLDAKAAATLDGSNFVLVLGIPITREQLTGTINGTNADFTTKYPIYPQSGRTMVPIAADISTYNRDDGPPIVDTANAASAVATGTDADTGYTIYNKVTVTTPPASETVDKIVADYYAYNDLYVQQSLKASEDVDSDELPRLGSKTKYKRYKGITTEVEVEAVLSDIKPILLGYDVADSQTGVAEGHVLYERRDIPLPILAYIPIFNEDETEDPADRGEMARIYLESVTVAPTMPEISAGDDAKVTLTLAVGAKPKILVVEEA